MQFFRLNKDKASDPIGFTFAFYQVLGCDQSGSVEGFQDFHSSGIINQSTNSTFIALVTKKSQTPEISDILTYLHVYIR